MGEQNIKSFLGELKKKQILGKGITAFKYEDNKYDVFSKVSDKEFYFFKIIDEQVAIKNKMYSMNVNQELTTILKTDTQTDLKSLINQIGLSNIISYAELYISDNGQPPYSLTKKENSDLELAEIFFTKGHNSSNYEEALYYYINGFLLGINYRMGLDISLDSLAKLTQANGHYIFALKLFEKCLKWKLGNELFIYFYIGECNYFLKNYKHAIEALNKTLLLRKSNPNALLLRAKCFLGIGQVENAKADLIDIINNTRNDYGLSMGDEMENSEKWQTYQQYGEVPIIHNARTLLSSL